MMGMSGSISWKEVYYYNILGGTLSMLGMSDCIDWKEAQDFVLTTQDSITGGKMKQRQ